MRLSIRAEQPLDHRAVEEMIRLAFWDVYRPGCVEHLLLRRLRRSAAYLPRLSRVATVGDLVVGHIAYSRVAIVGDPSQGANEQSVVGFGPLGVRPGWQHRGIGGRLVRETLDLAREDGHRAVVVEGSPRYYRRFGFGPAADYGLITSAGESVEYLQAIELYPAALSAIRGRVTWGDVFDMAAVENNPSTPDARD